MRKLKDRLTTRQLERRNARIADRKRDEERRFTLAWAEERRMPEKFKQARLAGTTEKTQQSLISKLASLVSLRRAG